MKSNLNHAIALYAILMAGSLIHSVPKETFVIVVPSYNNASCTERVLERLIDQKTTHPYRIICVNDCSRDNTGKIMDEFARKHNLSEPFFKIIHNSVRIGAMANIYNTIHEQCRDNEIVVLVDGDDFLNSNLVLERLEKEYSNPDIWMTYGQFIFFPSCEWGVCYEMTRDDLLNKRIRELTYVSQHLRTFKVKLFKKIKKEDLMLNGAFYAMNADMATMIPMLEMCAPKMSIRRSIAYSYRIYSIFITMLTRLVILEWTDNYN